jgi:hypothetical protein
MVAKIAKIWQFYTGNLKEGIKQFCQNEMFILNINNGEIHSD